MSNDRSLRLEVILAAIDRATGPMKSVMGGSSKLAQQLRDTKNQLKELNAVQKNVDGFRNTARAVSVAANELKGKQARLKELKAAMAETITPSKALAREFERVRNEAHAVATRHTKLVEKQQRLRDSLREAGINTKQLGTHQTELKARLDAVSASLTEQQARYKAVGAQMQRLAAARASYDKTIETRNKLAGAGASMTVAGAAMGTPVVNAIREYSSFEDAMLGVQRQVQGVGEVGSLAYKQVALEIKLLGRELPIPINQLADMYTAAARMDVPREGLRDFTRTVAMMATAFDAVPDEIAESMGKVAANFKIPLRDISQLADTINYLDDNAISKAGDIIGVLNRASGVAASVAITDKAVAALASTLLTLGDREETAGTAINAMLQKFAAAEKGSKSFQSAMGEIGLGLSDVQSGMQKDAQGTLFRIIEAIQRLPATKRTGVMVELVGMEHSDTMAKLVTNTAEWRRQIDLANSAAAEGSMQREFLKRMNALSSGWERFKNSFFDFNTEAGGAIRTSLMGTMGSIGSLLNSIADWMRANPALTAALVKIVAVTALIVTGMGALALAMAAVIGPFAVARYGMALFGLQGAGIFTTLMNLGRTALPLVGNAIMWIGRALLMNPIGLAITAIAVAALAIYKYWEPIKAFFGSLWEGIKTNFNTAVTWFSSLPARFAQFGTDMVRGLINGITGAMGAAKDAITSVGSNVVGWFKEKLGIRSPSRVFAELGGFTMQGLAVGLQGASGAPLAAIARTAGKLATAATVGMAGIAPAAAGGFTIDNRPPIGAAQMAGTSAVTQHNEIHIHAAPGMDPQAIALAVSAELDRRERAQAVRSRSILSDRY